MTKIKTSSKRKQSKLVNSLPSVRSLCKTLAVCLSLFVATVVTAIPAKRGLWRNITLKNGKQVKVELVGDEHFHFYRDAAGNVYVQNIYKTYSKKSLRKLNKMQKKAMKKRHKMKRNKSNKHFRR